MQWQSINQKFPRKERLAESTGFEGAHCILIMRNMVTEYKKYTLKNEKIHIKLVLREEQIQIDWIHDPASLPPKQPFCISLTFDYQ